MSDDSSPPFLTPAQEAVIFLLSLPRGIPSLY